MAACQEPLDNSASPVPDQVSIASDRVPFVSDRVKSENAKVRQYLDFSDTADLERSKRGFIATFNDGKITKADGTPVYDFGAYDFLTV